MASSENMAETTQTSTAEVEKITDVKEIIALLAQKFPLCFSVDGDAKPLKIGIFKDLAQRLEGEGIVSRTQLRQALRRYTSSWRYLKCVAKGGARFDLDGQQGEVLESDHIEHAVKALEESKARFEKKKKTVKDKKIYKKSQSDTGETGKNKAKFKGNKQRSAQTGKKNEQSKATNGNRQGGQNDKSVQTKLTPLNESLNKPGTRVLVKFGQSPVPGVIKEVSKGDIHVQLNSGMVIKTRFENIFLA